MLIEDITPEIRKEFFCAEGWYAPDTHILKWYEGKEDADYKIIRNGQASYVEREVTAYLNKGYTTAGGVFVSGGTYNQAIIKESK